MNLVLDSVLLSMSLLVKKRLIALAQERNFQQAWYESESQMNIADSHVKAEEQPNLDAFIPYPILAANPNPTLIAIADAYDSIPCSSFLEKQAYKRHQIFFRACIRCILFTTRCHFLVRFKAITRFNSRGFLLSIHVIWHTSSDD